MKTKIKCIYGAAVALIATVAVVVYPKVSMGTPAIPDAVCSSISNQAQSGPAIPVLVVGESWASGGRLLPELPQALSSSLGRPVLACSVGFSGKNSTKMVRSISRSYIASLFHGQQPSIVYVLDGVNDQIQHIGANVYADNTAAIAYMFPSAQVRVITVPTIRFDQRKLDILLRLKNSLQRWLKDGGKDDVRDDYRAALHTRHPDVHTIDYDAFMPVFAPSRYAPDGIHLTTVNFHQYGKFIGSIQ